MNRFIWMLRREVWEHKAIWVAPLIVVGLCLLLMFLPNVQLGPGVRMSGLGALAAQPPEKLARIVLLVHVGLTALVFTVMGIISFFYSLDSLYSDRRDRSVLFWKSLPLSDAETVLSKFTVACVLIPVIALLAAVLTQFVVAGVVAAKLSFTGGAAAILWHPHAVAGGIGIALLWCLTAMFWYAPVVAYLMLASAWAPRGPFLWAVLPPVALLLLERVLFYTDYAGNFLARRLFGLMQIQRTADELDIDPEAMAGGGAEVAEIARIDLSGHLLDFLRSPDLWLGVVAAALLLAASIWVRRYRDETS